MQVLEFQTLIVQSRAYHIDGKGGYDQRHATGDPARHFGDEGDRRPRGKHEHPASDPLLATPQPCRQVRKVISPGLGGQHVAPDGIELKVIQHAALSCAQYIAASSLLKITQWV